MTYNPALYRYIGFKLAMAGLAIASAVVLLLALIRLIPGDPATVILGSRATHEMVALLNARMGLDLPLGRQILQFFANALRGDLGVDVFNGRPVTALLAHALPNTALLAVSGLSLALLVGVPLGILGARRPGGFADRAIALISIGFVSTPSFVVAIVLLLVFSIQLRWFPVLGAGSGSFLDVLRHLVLPASALAIGWIGYIARLLRSSMLEVLGENHIRTMRAFGVSESTILLKYALRPAIVPTFAIVAMGFGELLGGAVFIEVIFNRPGLGSLIKDAIDTRNYPVVQGGVLLIVTLYVLTNLVADLLQTVLDPRERGRLTAEADAK